MADAHNLSSGPPPSFNSPRPPFGQTPMNGNQPMPQTNPGMQYGGAPPHMKGGPYMNQPQNFHQGMGPPGQQPGANSPPRPFGPPGSVARPPGPGGYMNPPTSAAHPGGYTPPPPGSFTPPHPGGYTPPPGGTSHSPQTVGLPRSYSAPVIRPAGAVSQAGLVNGHMMGQMTRPPMMNGPPGPGMQQQWGPRPGMPMQPPSSMAGPPSSAGQPTPPPMMVNSSGQQLPPPQIQAPPPQIQAPPPGQGQEGQGYTGGANGPRGLPVPYHGQAQYSHQLHATSLANDDCSTPGITPTNSAPPSQRSSRGPSPVPGTQWDALEGQFTPQPGKNSPGPPFPQAGGPSPPQPGQMPGQPGSMPGQMGVPQGQGQIPGMPPPPGQMPGMSPLPGTTQPGQMSGMPPPPGQMPGMPPHPGTTQPGQMPGMPPHPGTTQLGQMPGLPPLPGTTQPGQMPGMPPLPGTTQPGQMPGMPPVPGTTQPGQMPGMPPPPPSGGGGSGITGRRHYPQMPAYSQSSGAPPQPPPPSQMNAMPAMGTMPGALPNNAMNATQMNQRVPAPGAGYPNNTYPNNNAALNSSFSNMKLQQIPLEGRTINLLNERAIILPEGIETVEPKLQHDFKKVTCNPDVFRCTMTSIPQTQSLLSKSRLPLGILIHPFRDLSQLPVIQSSVIVRCRLCRTYINPFVTFVDMRRWKCNLCYRVNELPDEFNYDPVSKTYGEPQRRPEIRSATIEFIAPSEYMLRPPQPAVYLYVLDVSFNAVQTGYLKLFCQTLLEELDRVPGDSRTQIGFITFDRSLHFYNLSEGLSQPQMLVVSDVEDIFLPCPDSLLVNFYESRELITDLLSRLPSLFEKNVETGSALGPALQAAYKLMGGTGGRVSVFQTQLPTVGPGALKTREDPNERAGKNVLHLGPATDFYKKLSLECSAQQIAVDLFVLSSQYSDVASTACISKYSGGSVFYLPELHTINNPAESDRFEGTLRRYFTRKIGFEAVMRIRCTRGLAIHTFHGNFFVRSTDLLSLPNINPDSGFAMQMSIEDTLESSTACFQAALLYTSSKGERRIRVHTMCLPVTTGLNEIHASADQQAILGMLGKMAVDKCISQSMGDARDAMINAAIDVLNSYGQTLTSSQRMGQVPVLFSFRLIPVLVLALLKYVGFRIGSSTRLDHRVYALEQCKTLPLQYLIQEVYPTLYPVHALDDKNGVTKGDTVIPKPPVLQLSFSHVDRHGAYLMDANSRMYLYVGGAISDRFCQEVFDVPNFQSIPEGMHELPELDNPTSEKLRSFVSYLNDQRPYPAALQVIREDSRTKGRFLQHMVEDRTESTMSYYEFLQHLQKEMKG